MDHGSNQAAGQELARYTQARILDRDSYQKATTEISKLKAALEEAQQGVDVAYEKYLQEQAMAGLQAQRMLEERRQARNAYVYLNSTERPLKRHHSAPPIPNPSPFVQSPVQLPSHGVITPIYGEPMDPYARMHHPVPVHMQINQPTNPVSGWQSHSYGTAPPIAGPSASHSHAPHFNYQYRQESSHAAPVASGSVNEHRAPHVHPSHTGPPTTASYSNQPNQFHQVSSLPAQAVWPPKPTSAMSQSHHRSKVTHRTQSYEQAASTSSTPMQVPVHNNSWVHVNQTPAVPPTTQSFAVSHRTPVSLNQAQPVVSHQPPAPVPPAQPMPAYDPVEYQILVDAAVPILKPLRPAGIEIVLQLVAKRLSTPGTPLTLDDIPPMSQPEAMQVVKSTDQLYQIAKSHPSQTVLGFLKRMRNMLDQYQASNASGSKQTEAGSDPSSAATSVIPDKPESTVPQDTPIHSSDNTDPVAPPESNLQAEVTIKSENEIEIQTSIQRPVTPEVLELDDNSKTPTKPTVDQVNSNLEPEIQEIPIQNLTHEKQDQEWAPSQANKRRLAHDIMRALGRPTHSPTIPSPAPQDHDDNLEVSTETPQDNEVLYSRDSRESSEDPIPLLPFISDIPTEQQQQQKSDLQAEDTIDSTSKDVEGTSPISENITCDPETSNPTVSEVYDEIKTPGAIQMEELAQQEQVQQSLLSHTLNSFPVYHSGFPPQLQPYYAPPLSSPLIGSFLSSPPISSPEASAANSPRMVPEPIDQEAQLGTHPDSTMPPIEVLGATLPSPPSGSRMASPGVPSQKTQSYAEVPALSPFTESPRTPSQPNVSQTGRGNYETSSSVRDRDSQHVVQKSDREEMQAAVPSSGGASATPEADFDPALLSPFRRSLPTQAPLFLPSPTSEPADDGAVEVVSGEFVLDQSLLRDVAFTPQAPAVRVDKGKKRAVSVRDDSSEDEIQFLGKESPRDTPPDERHGRRPKTVERMMYVLLPSAPKRRRVVPKPKKEESTPRIEPKPTQSTTSSLLQPQQQQQEAFNLATTRLQAVKCQWKGCDAVLNCTKRLDNHLSHHVSESVAAKKLWCDWINCANRYTEVTSLREHVQSHARSTIICAREGCRFHPTSRRWIVLHHAEGYHKDDAWKPSAEFSALEPPKELQPLPESMPTHLSIERRVAKHQMSRGAHIRLGAKVAANIVCYVQPGGRSNAARPPRNIHRIAKRIAAIEKAVVNDPAVLNSRILRMSHDEYDAWSGEKYRSRPKFCDDLSTWEVTEMVQGGLVLFGGPEDETTPEGPEAPNRDDIEELGEEGDVQGIGEPVTCSVSSASGAGEGVAVSNADGEDPLDGIDTERNDAGVRNVGGSWELVDPAGHRRRDGVHAVALDRHDGWTADQDDEVEGGQLAAAASQAQSPSGPTDEEGVVEDLLWVTNQPRSESSLGPSVKSA